MDFATYSQSKHIEYAALADTVASILKAAITAHPAPFRLQQVQARAKSPNSLRKKLESRGLIETTNLAAGIKDLAGCRLIFYTNSDVSRFLQSGIIQDNFEVDWERTKIHYPVPGQSGPNDLFISNNFVVRLKSDRTNLPEYARFAGLACEVQIQTILHHAWSEMVHDILYKKPQLEAFGAKLYEAIEQRFQRIMKTYLLPAGYEFQKALEDYERLMSGKQLLDSDPLKVMAQGDNNDERLKVMEGFRDYVLPNYDDPVAVYPDIKEGLVAAVKKARTTKQQMVETPFGSYEGADAAKITGIACEILTQLRYVAVDTTFDAICELFPEAQTEGERKPILKLAEQLAQHNLDVWKQAGPFVQVVLVRKVSALDPANTQSLLPIKLVVLEETLKTEVHGISSTYSSVTLYSGSVVSSDSLATARSEALDILMNLYRGASSDGDRASIVRRLFAATEMPIQSNFSNELFARILSDSANVVVFFCEFAASDAYEITQETEDKLLWLHRRNIGIRNDKRIDASVRAAVDRLDESIKAFRKAADANTGFTTYKILVGYNSVFQPMWDDENFDIAEAAAYRKERIDELVSQIDDANADEWFAIMQRCARTESSDLATFPSFGEFLQKLARSKPEIVIGFLDKLDGRLVGFLGIILAGLAESSQPSVANEDRCLAEGRSLSPTNRTLCPACPTARSGYFEASLGSRYQTR